MNEQWIRDYIMLAFRIQRAFRLCGASWYVDNYYGPPNGRRNPGPSRTIGPASRSRWPLHWAMGWTTKDLSLRDGSPWQSRSGP